MYICSQFFGGGSDPGLIFCRFRGEEVVGVDAVFVGDFLFTGLIFIELPFCFSVFEGDDSLFEDGVDVINSLQMPELTSLRGDVLLVGVSIRSGVTAGDTFFFEIGSFCGTKSSVLSCVKYLDSVLEGGWDSCIDDDVCSSNLWINSFFGPETGRLRPLNRDFSSGTVIFHET